jgi:hypothetical protein
MFDRLAELCNKFETLAKFAAVKIRQTKYN